jgi:hypothetical protein
MDEIQDYLPGLEVDEKEEDSSPSVHEQEVRDIPTPKEDHNSQEFIETDESMTREQAEDFKWEIIDSKVLTSFIYHKTNKFDWMDITEKTIFYEESGKVKYIIDANDPDAVLKDRVRTILADFNNWKYKIEKKDSEENFNVSIYKPPLGITMRKKK